MLRKARDFALMLDFHDFCQGSGWLHRFKVRYGIVFKSIVAVEMVKVAWSEVAATCLRNCFRKADTKPEAKPDASDGQSRGDSWHRVIDSDMGGHDLRSDDLVCADEDADTAEPCTNEGIVNEVRGKSDALESDEDDDETSERAAINAPSAMGYIEDLKQLVYAKGLSKEHAAALNKVETAFIKSALPNQTAITDVAKK
ncbi:hypothetical protein HPB48_009658 [Haemaphysalis longicornis]|uniref:HTH CENPB-type domain-containing protein n=1 Tax=Haemaphysalis longicornis TaxID=44386 RepID=A0A9J6FCE0_HAELO|nr:hypothetical protein HPB48_009658 [Haemaphysalis longicornis]